MSRIDALAIRKQLGRTVWGTPRPFGPDGWIFDSLFDQRIIVSVSDLPDDDRLWVHASISRPDETPPYADLVQLHQAVWGDGHAYQCFVPPSEHINIHQHCLHLWGLLSGERLLPDFGFAGSI